MYCFFDVFVAVTVVVATALYFDLKGTVSWHGKIQHVFVYKKGTTGYYENIPVLLRGTFYTQEQWNFHQNYEYFVI